MLVVFLLRSNSLQLPRLRLCLLLIILLNLTLSTLLTWWLWLFHFFLFNFFFIHCWFLIMCSLFMSKAFVLINILIIKFFIKRTPPIFHLIFIDHWFESRKTWWRFPSWLIFSQTFPLNFIIGLSTHELFAKNFVGLLHVC